MADLPKQPSIITQVHICELPPNPETIRTIAPPPTLKVPVPGTFAQGVLSICYMSEGYQPLQSSVAGYSCRPMLQFAATFFVFVHLFFDELLMLVHKPHFLSHKGSRSLQVVMQDSTLPTQRYICGNDEFIICGTAQPNLDELTAHIERILQIEHTSHQNKECCFVKCVCLSPPKAA